MKLCRSAVDGSLCTPCCYCGLPADTRDHFVPRSYRKIIAQWREIQGWEHVPDTVPACGQCNTIAGANVFPTLAAKRKFIHAELRRKYARVLAQPIWYEDEIEELGKNLKTHIARRENQKIRLLLRLSWPYDSEIEALTLAIHRGSDDPAYALNEIRRLEILR